MYKVKCTLIEFVGDERKYPCHFNYKIGDEIYYDGVHFTGRICPGLLPSMMPVVHGTYLLGHKFTETVMHRYRGSDTRDPQMEVYDGGGYRPVISPASPETAGKEGEFEKKSSTGRFSGHHFLCGDQRTLAHFTCEAVDLSDSYYAQPFYRREISILDKIASEPGINTNEIIDRFTEFQKNVISPRLTPVLMGVLLEALEDMDYISIKDGKAYATGKEPPSRPKITSSEEYERSMKL